MPRAPSAKETIKYSSISYVLNTASEFRFEDSWWLFHCAMRFYGGNVLVAEPGGLYSEMLRPTDMNVTLPE